MEQTPQGVGVQTTEVATLTMDPLMIGDLERTDNQGDHPWVGLDPHLRVGQEVGMMMDQEDMTVAWETDFAGPGLPTGERFHLATSGTE